jgi:hypothetical protein
VRISSAAALGLPPLGEVYRLMGVKDGISLRCSIFILRVTIELGRMKIDARRTDM